APLHDYCAGVNPEWPASCVAWTRLEAESFSPFYFPVADGEFDDGTAVAALAAYWPSGNWTIGLDPSDSGPSTWPATLVVPIPCWCNSSDVCHHADLVGPPD